MKDIKKLIYLSVAMILMILSLGWLKESRMAYATEQPLSACTLCENLDGFVSPGQIDERIRQMVGKYKGGGGAKNVAIQKDRGVTETHLNPNFIDKGDCPKIDSEKWAIDYSHKRNRPALHKGIDIPQPRGTPVIAIADGVVVTPKDAYFMDPNAFYRPEPPYDSPSLADLPKNQKQVPVPYMKSDKTLVPSSQSEFGPTCVNNSNSENMPQPSFHQVPKAPGFYF